MPPHSTVSPSSSSLDSLRCIRVRTYQTKRRLPIPPRPKSISACRFEAKALRAKVVKNDHALPRDLGVLGNAYAADLILKADFRSVRTAPGYAALQRFAPALQAIGIVHRFATELS